MISKANFLWIILFGIFLHIPYIFSGEIYRWMDEKGIVHFTDDLSKIPKPYSDQVEKIEVQEETLKEGEIIGKPEEEPDRIRDYLEKVEKTIELKKSMEKKISELEEELKSSEERLKESRNMKGKTSSIISHSDIQGQGNGCLLPHLIMKKRVG